MGDTYPTVKVAAIQAAPIFLDREASTAKACELIRRAGREGARLIAFPEGFIPAHPVWYHLHPATGQIARRLSVELFKNSVEIPSIEIEQLRLAAADANAYVVMGICEKLPNTMSTMYNTQVFLGPNGDYLGKRQKLTPTGGERLVHAPGQGAMLRAIQTDFGPTSALLCGENANPLAIFALAAQHTRIHVMSWPHHFSAPRTMQERALADAMAFAQMARCYVVSTCGIIDERMVESMQVSDEVGEKLLGPEYGGGSVIVGPNSKVIAGPLGSDEGILYADLDLELPLHLKLVQDYAGHYNRPDVFHLQVSGDARPILEMTSEPARPARDYDEPVEIDWRPGPLGIANRVTPELPGAL